MRDWAWPAIGWLAAAAHVAAFSAAARRGLAARPIRGAAYAGCSAAASLLPVAACAVEPDRCAPHTGSLSISIVVSRAPWCAMFAVALCGAAFGARRAMTRAGAPACGAAAMAGFAVIAAAPDAGAVLQWVHECALAATLVAGLVFAAHGVDGRRCGLGRVALIRAHVVAGVAWGALATACVWHPQQTRATRMVAMLAETASFLHTAAAVV